MAYKVKNQIPDLEDLKVDQWYAITINPQDKYQRFNRQDRHNECLHDLRDKILITIDSYDYKLWPELSSKGRFHVHGIIRVTHKINFYTHCVPALLSRGTVVIKPIEQEDEWEKYCTKQEEYHEYLNEVSVHVIPLVHTTNATKHKASVQSIDTMKLSKESEKLFAKRFNLARGNIDNN